MRQDARALHRPRPWSRRSEASGAAGVQGTRASPAGAREALGGARSSLPSMPCVVAFPAPKHHLQNRSGQNWPGPEPSEWQCDPSLPKAVSAGRRPFAEADGNRTRPPSLPGALVLKTRRATRPQSPPGSGYLWSGIVPATLTSPGRAEQEHWPRPPSPLRRLQDRPQLCQVPAVCPTHGGGHERGCHL